MNIIDNKLGYKIFDINIQPLQQLVVDRINQLGTLNVTINDLPNLHNIVQQRDFKRLTRNFQYSRWVVLDDNAVKSIRDSVGIHDADILSHGSTAVAPQDYDIGVFMIVRPSPYPSFVINMHSDKEGCGCDYNVWIPLAGFGKEYSLAVIPSSHLWDNSTTNKWHSSLTYNEVETKEEPTRLNIKNGQGVIFHSNLLHGNSFNEGTDTRISLEVRFFYKDSPNIIKKKKNKIKEVIYVN